MWFDGLQRLFASDEVRRTQVINAPVEAGDRILGSIPNELVPMLQLAALYRLAAARLDEQAELVMTQSFRKDRELRLRAQAATLRTMILGLAGIFHCCMLEHCAKQGMNGGDFQLLLSQQYEVREGWVIVALTHH